MLHVRTSALGREAEAEAQTVTWAEGEDKERLLI